MCVCVCARAPFTLDAARLETSATDIGIFARVKRQSIDPYKSINQSEILIEPHTGKEKPIPALPQRAVNPASRSDTDPDPTC